MRDFIGSVAVNMSAPLAKTVIRVLPDDGQ